MATICFYHADCFDGFASAWVVYRAHKEGVLQGEIEFQAINYHQSLSNYEGKDVIMVDFSVKPEALEEMAKKASSVLIIDHHKSAIQRLDSYTSFPKELSDNYFVISTVKVYNKVKSEANGVPFVGTNFSLGNSGCVLTWMFFFTTKIPAILEYIEDSDLGKFESPITGNVVAGISTYPETFKAWDEMIYKDPFSELLEKGQIIQEYKRRLVEKHLKRGYILIEMRSRDRSYKVPCILAPREIVTAVATTLAKDFPFAVGFYMDEGHWVFELRASKESEVDVSEIATLYGGGGHQKAAGIRISDQTLVDYTNQYAIVFDINSVFDLVLETAYDNLHGEYK